MTYATAANVNALTGNMFDPGEVTAAITVADNKIDSRLGELTFSTTPQAVKTLADEYAARVLLSGLKVQKLAEGKVSDYRLPDFTKEEKELLDTILQQDVVVSHYSQDYQ